MLIRYKKVCRKCGGSGRKIIPESRRVSFKRCSHCGGKGVRFEALRLPIEVVS